MSEFRFESTITGAEELPVDTVRERAYGAVRVTADWRDRGVVLRVTGDVDRRDAPAFVELFFHDIFLLLNLAAPGSFDGTITTSGGELRVRQLTFSARIFANAGGNRLPLESVAKWYDSLQLGTRQLAATPEAIALFELLHLARNDEDDEQSILRLARAAEALLGRPESLRRLFELRDDIARGRTPVIHPLHDDALDPRVEDATREWIEVADAAAAQVIRALQGIITGSASPPCSPPAP
ncbi:MAG TPA: hypothetical protein VEU30_11045 [Thermoanaerobaculia bacterium]|nr:hypothetical protein [Thermoanaerobaculia bacterium]